MESQIRYVERQHMCSQVELIELVIDTIQELPSNGHLVTKLPKLIRGTSLAFT